MAYPQQPKIIWDQGSAYDLFVSLWILHRPDEFGLRPSWAAGVRSRLPSDLRDVLEQAQSFMNVPMQWVFRLPPPKDAEAVLTELKALAPEDRLPELIFGDVCCPGSETPYRQFLLSLDGKQRLTARIEEQIQEFHKKSKKVSKAAIRAVFDAWSNRSQFGELFYQAITAYVENFFREEEARIHPVQENGLKKARALAEEKDLLTLLEELSSGVRMDWITEVSRVILVPSFWSSPFVFFDDLDDETEMVLFGARPKDVALVPGEVVPEVLLNALKALADPTRLRILKHLLAGPSTPSELAKTLRLRAPTVIHHLHILRLAGLVLVTVSAKAERRYAARMEGVQATLTLLEEFLSGD
jgi:DNA-binding transcriptional ArsR family regulator